MPRGHLRRFLAWWLLLTAEFAVVFGGTNYLTSLHDWRIHAYSQAELAVPLVPVMVVPYMSVYLLFPFMPFALRTGSELDRFGRAMARMILVAGAAFILFPATLGFAPAAAQAAASGSADALRWVDWLRLADLANLDYNLVPSLHVALFAVCAGVFAARAAAPVRLLLAFWLTVVAVSTVLTHQHHVVDVIAGLALGAWGIRAATGRIAIPVSGTNRSFGDATHTARHSRSAAAPRTAQ